MAFHASKRHGGRSLQTNYGVIVGRGANRGTVEVLCHIKSSIARRQMPIPQYEDGPLRPAQVCRRPAARVGDKCSRLLGREPWDQELPFFNAGCSLRCSSSHPSRRRCAQGVALSGVGPVNLAMGGAATAAPIDAAGAPMWNPGSINALSSSQVDIGLELRPPTEKLASSAFGAQGSTGGEPGAMAIPELAWVHKCDDSPWAYGIGIGGIGGFATNYPASTTNPVLKGQPLGLGQISSLAEYYQVVPTVSYALNDRLSFGFAPSLTIGKLDVTPEVFAARPYVSGIDGTRYHFGGGFQLGLYYQPTDA